MKVNKLHFFGFLKTIRKFHCVVNKKKIIHGHQNPIGFNVEEGFDFYFLQQAVISSPCT
jgi:hypothetical protein